MAKKKITAEEQVEQPAQPTIKEIPENVDAILKLFPEHESLYISTTGMVFTSVTQPEKVGASILYKNPHYKSKTQ